MNSKPTIDWLNLYLGFFILFTVCVLIISGAKHISATAEIADSLTFWELGFQLGLGVAVIDSACRFLPFVYRFVFGKDKKDIERIGE